MNVLTYTGLSKLVNKIRENFAPLSHVSTKASSSILGHVKVGINLSIDNDGTLNAIAPLYSDFVGSGPNASSGLVPAPPTTAGTTKYLREDGNWIDLAITEGGGVTESYVHPTTSGNKHIPSGGSSGQILRWSADGTAVWGQDNNTTYTGSDGINLVETNFVNSGVRSVSTGSSNGSISANINGTVSDIAVKGLGSAAYTSSNDYLAITGGTMTGDIIRNTTLAKNSVDDSYVNIFGGTTENNGASLKLNGRTASGDNGTFYLYSNNGSTSRYLKGTANGNLTWNGRTVNTQSDRRSKTMFSDIPGKTLQAWQNVQWLRFKFIEDVQIKGADNCRYHVGLVAQDVNEICEENNTDICEYGILCYDDIEDNWTIRYEEALCMEAAYQRNENKKLLARIEELEERISELEAKI